MPNDQNPGDVATIIEETTDRKLTKESRQKKLFSRQVLSVAIFLSMFCPDTERNRIIASEMNVIVLNVPNDSYEIWLVSSINFVRIIESVSKL